MKISVLGFAAGLLMFANMVSAAVPVILGTWTGQDTKTVLSCSGDQSLVGDTAVETITLNVTSQTPATATEDIIQGTASNSDHIFWSADTETFTGVIFDDGTIVINLSPSGDVATATYANGVITVNPDVPDLPDKDPYLAELCVVAGTTFTMTGGTQAINPTDTAATAIIAGNTQVLQTFVNNTIMPVATRIQNIVVNLVKPELVSESSRFDMTPMAGGFKLSGQTGRSAGGDLQNLAGWGSVSYTELENDNPQTAYDGDRMAFQFGLDFMPRDNMVAGISLGYEDMDVTTTFNQGSMDGQGYTVAPYIGGIIDDSWSYDALVGLSTVDYDQNRSSGTISGSTEATRFFAATNLNHTYGIKDKWLIISRAGLMYAEETTDGFTESDGTVNPERRTRLIQGQLGADFTYLAGDNFEPYLNATYNFDFISSGTNIVAGGVSVNPFDDRDDLLFGAGFNYYVSDNSSASMELKHRVLRDDFEETIFSASYRANF